MRPSKNESPQNFGARVQDARSLIISKLNSSVMTAAEKVLQLKNYDDLSLKTFIRGLSGQLQYTVRLRNPASLEQAITFVIEEENFQYAQGQSQVFTNRFNPIPRQQIIKQPLNMPVRPQRFPVQYPQFSNAHPPYRPNNSFAPNFSQFPSNNSPRFPSQPINVQPRYIPQNFPTNRQVFGPPKDVFKPTGQAPTNKPTHMSTTSTHTVKKQPHMPNQHPHRVSNYFQSSGPRNFVSQELYNIDSDYYPANNQYYEYYPEEYCHYTANNYSHYEYQPEFNYENNNEFTDPSQVNYYPDPQPGPSNNCPNLPIQENPINPDPVNNEPEVDLNFYMVEPSKKTT